MAAGCKQDHHQRLYDRVVRAAGAHDGMIPDSTRKPAARLHLPVAGGETKSHVMNLSQSVEETALNGDADCMRTIVGLEFC
jgi:hypothetical protein